MPSLVLFGKNLPVAGDDLRTYSLVLLGWRLAQLVIVIDFIVLLAGNDDQYEKQLELVVDDLDYEQASNNTSNNTTTTQEEELKLCPLEHEDDLEKLRDITTAFLAFSMVLAFLGVIYAIAVWIVSQRGTPTNHAKREGPLRRLCQFHLTGMVAIRTVTVTLGSILFQSLDQVCQCINTETRTVDRCTMRFYGEFHFVLVSQYAEIILNAAVLIYVASSWILPSIVPRELDSENRWRCCCWCCCTITSIFTCCLMGGREAVLGDYTDIAMLFSDFFDFHGTLDVTHSDIVVGLLLVKEVQRQRAEEVRRMIIAESKEKDDDDDDAEEELPNNQHDNETSSLSSPDQSTDNLEGKVENLTENNFRRTVKQFRQANTFSGITYRLKRYGNGQYTWEPAVSILLKGGNSEDRLAIAEGARFMRLSSAIYTWIMYSINRPCTGLCTIWCLAAAKSCQRRHAIFPGDGYCCRLHSTAFMKEARISEETEIVYAQFLSDVVASPYAVVLDHEWKSIVIVIRGTLSLEDVLTDLEIKPTCLEEVGKEFGFDGCTTYVHGGFLATCLWILKDLAKRDILEKLLEEGSKYSDYRVRVTGHSLGAGCAAILGMLLKPKYPDIRCHCFSTPGCTVSENAAKECEDYITSYVLDADIIPRASLNALENMRQDAVEMVSRIKVKKSTVLNEFLHGCTSGDPETRLDRMLYEEDEIPNSNFVREWKEYRRLYSERKMERGIEIELFIPGKIVHFFHATHTQSSSFFSSLTGYLDCSSKQKGYAARWANRLDFREIMLRSHMLDDHNPMAVLNGIEAAAESFGMEVPFVQESGRQESLSLNSIAVGTFRD